MIEQKHLYVSQTTEHTIIQIHSVLKLLCKTVYKNIRPLIPLYIGCNVGSSCFFSTYLKENTISSQAYFLLVQPVLISNVV